MAESLSFVAEIYKVQTLVDRGLRVTLDLPETAAIEAAKMMQFQVIGVAVRVEVEPLQNREDQRAISEGAKRKSRWSAAQE